METTIPTPTLPSLDLDAADLGAWFERHAPERWWNVDGDDTIPVRTRIPCSGKDLAVYFRKRGGVVRIFLPDGVERERVPDDLEVLGKRYNDSTVFYMAWLSEDGPGEVWELAEDPGSRAAWEELQRVEREIADEEGDATVGAN